MTTHTDPAYPSLASIREGMRDLNVGRSKIYDLMDRGELVSVKIGSRRLIVRPSIGELIERLIKATT